MMSVFGRALVLLRGHLDNRLTWTKQSSQVGLVLEMCIGGAQRIRRGSTGPTCATPALDQAVSFHLVHIGKSSSRRRLLMIQR